MRSPNLRANVDGPRRVPPTVVVTVGGTIGPSWVHFVLILALSGGNLGPSWGNLELSWGNIGSVLEPLGAIL